jgi:hypothetical protein
MAERPHPLYKKRKHFKNQFLNQAPSKKEIFQHLNLEDITIEVTFQSELIIKVQT